MMAKMRSVPRRSGGGSMIDTSKVILLLFFLLLKAVIRERRLGRVERSHNRDPENISGLSSGPRSTTLTGGSARFVPRGLYELGSSASFRMLWRLHRCLLCSTSRRFYATLDDLIHYIKVARMILN